MSLFYTFWINLFWKVRKSAFIKKNSVIPNATCVPLPCVVASLLFRPFPALPYLISHCWMIQQELLAFHMEIDPSSCLQTTRNVISWFWPSGHLLLLTLCCVTKLYPAQHWLPSLAGCVSPKSITQAFSKKKNSILFCLFFPILAKDFPEWKDTLTPWFFLWFVPVQVQLLLVFGNAEMQNLIQLCSSHYGKEIWISKSPLIYQKILVNSPLRRRGAGCPSQGSVVPWLYRCFAAFPSVSPNSCGLYLTLQ